MMQGTMMSVPLTIDLFVERAAKETGHVEVVSRRADKSIHRTTYAAIAERAKKLAHALVGAGIHKGDRVATLMWNHAPHLETYFGVPLAGAIVHTLNLRLHPDDIAFIAEDAGDRFLIVDEVLLPLYEKFRAAVPFEKVIVVNATKESAFIDYEKFIADAGNHALPKLEENDGLGMCYSSGTTGKPKGVVYTHRSTILHSLVSALPDGLDLSRSDTLLAVVPMFHVNAWGLPYTAALVGAKQIFPGPHLDAESLLDLMATEKVNVAAGVPTIWLGIKEALDAHKDRWKLVPGLRMIVGGSAAPEQLIRDFDRHGLFLLHAWGMTETSPIGLVSRVPPEAAGEPENVRYALRAKQGMPPPLAQTRVRNDTGEVPHDGKTSGELQIRAPWVASSYATAPDPARWTDDGFFKTGDVATIDKFGFVQLTDRTADLIKSGGEWIASVTLENALMGHPAIREAAVIGVPHAKWSERPIAVVVLKPDQKTQIEDLRKFLEPHFAKYWLPDAVVFVEALPRTTTGKVKKSELRAQYKDWKW